MDKEIIVDNNVMGIHLTNVRDAVNKAISHNNKTIVGGGTCDAYATTLQAHFVRENLKEIKEQVLMAELYIAKQSE